MNKLSNRKSIRLKNYDYSKSGMYYVTFCTNYRKCLFGEIVDGEMVLNDMGKTVENIWQSLPDHHPVTLDAFQIMPNHIHFIIRLTGGSRPTPTKLDTHTVGATRGSPTLGTGMNIQKISRNTFQSYI